MKENKYWKYVKMYWIKGREIIYIKEFIEPYSLTIHVLLSFSFIFSNMVGLRIWHRRSIHLIKVNGKKIVIKDQEQASFLESLWFISLKLDCCLIGFTFNQEHQDFSRLFLKYFDQLRLALNHRISWIFNNQQIWLTQLMLIYYNFLMVSYQ
jgi:hypothetical protein